MRTVNPVLPDEVGSHEGLSYSLWLPPAPRAPGAGIVILHGAGSCKESHHEFARSAVAAGFAALAFDQRGHGASGGAMDSGVLRDVARAALLLRSRCGRPELPLVLRGSSMGGYMAILAASRVPAQAVVAICPASGEGLRRALLAGELQFAAQVDELERFLAHHDLHRAVESLEIPLLLLHAEGDELVPVEHSRELAERVRSTGSRLITVPGGHHRSVQQDPELTAVSLRWIRGVLDQ